jgi:hypothetical protein
MNTLHESLDDFSDITKRYSECYHTSNPTIETFDIIKYLSYFEDYLKTNDFYICIRNEICNCKRKEKCICDDDNFIKIQKHVFDICSNCKFNMDFYLPETIKLKKKKILRIFTFDKDNESEEISVMDIMPSINKILIYQKPELLIDINDKISLKNNKLCISLDYMSYDIDNNDDNNENDLK